MGYLVLVNPYTHLGNNCTVEIGIFPHHKKSVWLYARLNQKLPVPLKDWIYTLILLEVKINFKFKKGVGIAIKSKETSS